MSEETVCPSCDKELSSYRGMKTHHAIVHGKSIAGEPVSCSWCDSVIYRRRNVAERQDYFFCDYSCQSKWGEENNKGEDNNNWRGGNIKVDCHKCSESFLRKPSLADKYDTHFCSDECRISFMKDDPEEYFNLPDHNILTCEHCNSTYIRIPSKTNNSRFCSAECRDEWMRKERVVVECYTCGTDIKRLKSYIENHDRQFCSKDCYTMKRETNPFWKGGHDGHYGITYAEFREYVLDRDDYTCQLCGMDRKEHYDKYDEDLHAHHILPIRLFDDPNNANFSENGLTTCLACNNHQRGREPIVVHPEAGDISNVTKSPPI